MPRFTSFVFAATAVFCLAAAFQSTQSDAAVYSPEPSLSADDVVPVEDSMHEFMEYVFQPAYLRLKQSMATAPADNKGWKAIKADSLTLAESCNLLYGRKPAEHGDDWVRHATASREQGAMLYKAAKEKNFESATAAWKTMLDRCNSCHKQFEDGKHILTP